MGVFERDILADLTPCRPQAADIVCESVAKVHAELLLIHPFREGNGRLARLVADIMFTQAGMTIPDYGFTDRKTGGVRQNYLAAVMKGYCQDYSDLAAFFLESLERASAIDLNFDKASGDAPSNTDDS